MAGFLVTSAFAADISKFVMDGLDALGPDAKAAVGARLDDLYERYLKIKYECGAVLLPDSFAVEGPPFTPAEISFAGTPPPPPPPPLATSDQSVPAAFTLRHPTTASHTSSPVPQVAKSSGGAARKRPTSKLMDGDTPGDDSKREPPPKKRATEPAPRAPSAKGNDDEDGASVAIGPSHKNGVTDYDVEDPIFDAYRTERVMSLTKTMYAKSGGVPTGVPRTALVDERHVTIVRELADVPGAAAPAGMIVVDRARRVYFVPANRKQGARDWCLLWQIHGNKDRQPFSATFVIPQAKEITHHNRMQHPHDMHLFKFDRKLKLWLRKDSKRDVFTPGAIPIVFDAESFRNPFHPIGILTPEHVSTAPIPTPDKMRAHVVEAATTVLPKAAQPRKRVPAVKPTTPVPTQKTRDGAASVMEGNERIIVQRFLPPAKQPHVDKTSDGRASGKRGAKAKGAPSKRPRVTSFIDAEAEERGADDEDCDSQDGDASQDEEADGSQQGSGDEDVAEPGDGEPLEEEDDMGGELADMAPEEDDDDDAAAPVGAGEDD